MIVKKGSLVKLHFTGKLENGEVFGSSIDSEPIECRIGEDKLIKGIEEELIGMKEAEKKEIVVYANKGYGKRDKSLVKKTSKDILGSRNIEIGQAIKLKSETGRVINAEVLAIESDTVTLDLNHPLAGKTLKFDIEIVEIR
ncbi:MAG: FKBP-type peptidyl-prolyl cis-trans isomerase [Candidatus Omnitrophica bacterium]|nr:FKBP-type peptidyl-prolyl cis-trans isomerase [Candidatus Omnitrophota bacterium]